MIITSTTLKKVGNSTGIILPKKIFEQIGIGIGDQLEVIAMKSSITLNIPQKNRKKFRDIAKPLWSIAEPDDDFDEEEACE